MSFTVNAFEPNSMLYNMQHRQQINIHSTMSSIIFLIGVIWGVVFVESLRYLFTKLCFGCILYGEHCDLHKSVRKSKRRLTRRRTTTTTTSEESHPHHLHETDDQHLSESSSTRKRKRLSSPESNYRCKCTICVQSRSTDAELPVFVKIESVEPTARGDVEPIYTPVITKLEPESPLPVSSTSQVAENVGSEKEEKATFTEQPVLSVVDLALSEAKEATTIAVLGEKKDNGIIDTEYEVVEQVMEESSIGK